eukprot:85646_1
MSDTCCPSKSPNIQELYWEDNGKISFSFLFKPSSTHRIIGYEMYYSYINSADDKWFIYAQNHWKIIYISSKNKINKNIQLRIATNKDIYNENKNKNIELIIKIRCELKHIDYWNYATLWSQFSDIYYVKSISIPFINVSVSFINNS